MNIETLVESVGKDTNPLANHSEIMDAIKTGIPEYLLRKLSFVKNYEILYAIAEIDDLKGYIAYQVFLTLKDMGSGDDDSVNALLGEKMSQAYNKR